MSEQGTALKKRSADALTPGVEADRVRSAMEQLKAMRQFVAGEMVDGLDFGAIPGTGPKPVLLLPGAQKVVMYYNACPDYQIATAELGEGHVEYLITAKLLSRGNGSIVGAGVGSCSTMESKYRFRTRGRTCPQCGAEAIIAGKAEYGGGFVCFKKKGGCGAKFRADDPTITSQQAGQIENDNIYDVRNTVLKMAKKRALVDAAIGLGCLAELFTQDLDDFLGFPEGAQASPARQAPVDSPPSDIKVAKASPYKPASANQLATIAQLSRLLGYPDEDWSQMTSAEASERIRRLSDEYNERKSAAHVATEQVQTTQEPAQAHPLASILGARVQALMQTTADTKEGIMDRVCDLEGLRRNGKIPWSTFGEGEYQRLITRVEREIESARAETSETDADVAQMLPF